MYISRTTGRKDVQTSFSDSASEGHWICYQEMFNNA